MRGFRYFLVVLAGVAGLSVSIKLVYSRNPAVSRAAANSAPVERPEPAPAPPPRVDSTVAPVDDVTPPQATSPASSATTVRRPPARRVSPQVDSPPAVHTASGAVAEQGPPPAAQDRPQGSSEPAPSWQATPRQVVRDSAYIMSSSGRIQDAIVVLDGWVRDHPQDTDIAVDLARLKARAGDWQGSIAQYSALIERDPTPQLLFERGQTYLWSGDPRRGEADLLHSEQKLARVETERQLGDHYRWQGDLARAASWYRRALQSAPGDSAALSGLRHLDRAIDARLTQPGELSSRDFGSGAQAISDNAGFGLYALRMGQAVPTGGAMTITFTGELRSASQVSAGGLESQIDALGADVSVASRIGTSKVTASAGVLDHAGVPALFRGSVIADGFAGSARIRASLRRLPAYEALWAPRMLAVAGSPATAFQGQASLSLPLGRAAEASLLGEYLGVSDDNTRTAVQLAVRHRLAGPWSLVYAGSLMAFDRQVALYYSPARYHSESLGLEVARYREQGVSFALRATPGYAWMREPSGIASVTTRDVSAFQFTTGLELGYRRGPWDLLLTTGVSSGREGGYRSQNAMLWFRRSWE